MTKDIKDILKAQSKAVRTYRREKFWSNKCTWIWIASIIIMIVCPFLCNLHFQSDTYPVLNALLSILFNVSIGYFTGFLVYLFVTFFPTTKKDVLIMDGVYFNLCMVSENLKCIESKVLPGIGVVNYDKYTSQLFNFLVVDSNISTINADEPMPKKLIVNENNYAFVLSFLRLTRQSINRLITSYERDIENSYLEVLADISNLEEDFANARKGNEFSYALLYNFIVDFQSIGNLKLMHIVNMYKKYKYSDCDAERIKINYKNGY